jgi:hypothetical protein
MPLRHGTAAQPAFAGSVDGAGYIAGRQQGPRQVERRRWIVWQRLLAGTEQRARPRRRVRWPEGLSRNAAPPTGRGGPAERAGQQIERLGWRAKPQAAQSEDTQRPRWRRILLGKGCQQCRRCRIITGTVMGFRIRDHCIDVQTNGAAHVG